MDFNNDGFIDGHDQLKIETEASAEPERGAPAPTSKTAKPGKPGKKTKTGEAARTPPDKAKEPIYLLIDDTTTALGLEEVDGHVPMILSGEVITPERLAIAAGQAAGNPEKLMLYKCTKMRPVFTLEEE